MKMIKMALLGGAALAVTTVAAKADDLSALKAQIESLNARVASMEAAPSVPAGYSLLSITDSTAYAVPGMTREEQAGFAGDTTLVSVLPTADAPAAASIEWNGFARAMLRYTATDVKGGANTDAWNIRARGRLNVTAKTDTAVGEVGVRLRLEGNDDGPTNLDVDMPVAWGWWQMTPELTLGGGFQGSLGNVGFGYDSCAECNMIDGADVYANNGPLATSDTSQMRLSYASGPLGFAVALEDAEASGGDGLGAAGEISYSGDTLSGEISGMYRDTPGEETYAIGAGLGFSMDPVGLSFAAGMAHGLTGFGVADAWYVNGLATINLSDEIYAEGGAGYKVYDFDVAGLGDREVFGVMGGLYYKPVDQLTIGVEAEYTSVDHVVDSDSITAGLVTRYSF